MINGNRKEIRKPADNKRFGVSRAEKCVFGGFVPAQPFVSVDREVPRKPPARQAAARYSRFIQFIE